MESCNVWFLCLVSFIWQGVFKVHQPCNLYEYSIFFNGSVIFCCKYIPLFVYPFISWWAFGLFLPFGCCEQCSCEQCVYTYILVWIPVFSSLVPFIQVKLWGHMVILSLTFWGTAKLFSTIIVTAVSTRVPISLHACLQWLCIIWLFDSSHPSGYVVVSHYGFELHFLDD